jgi:hypothetical protein
MDKIVVLQHLPRHQNFAATSVCSLSRRRVHSLTTQTSYHRQFCPLLFHNKWHIPRAQTSATLPADQTSLGTRRGEHPWQQHLRDEERTFHTFHTTHHVLVGSCQDQSMFHAYNTPSRGIEAQEKRKIERRQRNAGHQYQYPIHHRNLLHVPLPLP